MTPNSKDEINRPRSLGPKKYVLSLMLQDPQEFIPRAVEKNLARCHFQLPEYAMIYEAMLEAFSAGTEIEPSSFVQTLSDSGPLDQVGGSVAITDIYVFAS